MKITRNVFRLPLKFTFNIKPLIFMKSAYFIQKTPKLDINYSKIINKSKEIYTFEKFDKAMNSYFIKYHYV